MAAPSPTSSESWPPRAGNGDLAIQHLRDAINFNQRTGQVPAELWSKLRLAEVLLDAGEHERAATLANDVRANARPRSFIALDEAAGRVLERHALRGATVTTELRQSPP